MAKRGNFDILSHYTWCIPSVADMFIMLLFLLLGAVIGNVIVFVFMAVMGQAAAMEYGTLVSYPVMFIPPMLWASSVSRRNALSFKGARLDNNHFEPLGAWACAALVILATFTCGVLGDAAGSLLPPMPEWLETTLKSMTTGKFWVNFLCVSIFAPFFEEWLCRGMILRGLLVRRVKPAWAIVISAVFFAFIHMNPWQAVPAFILGCLFGFVYYRTGSLKLTMLMHFTNNTVALVLGHISSLDEMDTWMDVLGSGYWYVFAACVVLLGLAVNAFRRIHLSKPEGNIDIVPAAFDD